LQGFFIGVTYDTWTGKMSAEPRMAVMQEARSALLEITIRIRRAHPDELAGNTSHDTNVHSASGKRRPTCGIFGNAPAMVIEDVDGFCPRSIPEKTERGNRDNEKLSHIISPKNERGTRLAPH